MPNRYISPPDKESFYAQVWDIVRQIPTGKVSTYGQIGSMIPAPQSIDPADYGAFAARWTGGAMANCPPDVPWQRVINAQGKISLPIGGGYERQLELLLSEGVEVNERGKIDLGRFGWQGPPREWVLARGLLMPKPLSR
jgi:methylated-DNA-protein-cysteine methyltransferase related protein